MSGYPDKNNTDKQYSNTILIVDDDTANLKILSTILRANGYKVRFANSGNQALNSVKALMPDLILLDIKMPGMNGYEVCTALKKNPDNAVIPVIFISAFSDKKDKIKAFKAGGIDFITKPFVEEEIIFCIKGHLELFNLNQSLRRAKEAAEERERLIKKQHVELTDQETKYRTLFNEAIDAIMILNPDGTLFDCNKAACKHFKLTKEKFIGLAPWEVSPEYQSDNEKTRTKANKILKQVLNNKPQHFEWKVINRQGKIFVASVALSKIELSGATYIQTIFKDITEQKEVQKELEESHKRYKLLFNASNDGVFVHYLKEGEEPGRFVEVNDVACRRLGYNREEFLRMTPAHIDAIDMADKRRKDFNIVAGKGSHVFEMVHVSKCKKNIPVEISSKKFSLKDEEFVLSIVRDITERKNAEKALRDSKRQLELIFDNSTSILLLVNTQAGIVKVNKTGIALAGSTEKDILNQQPGDAFHCINNGIAEGKGCGYGEECGDCIIRSTISDTLKNKKSKYKVEAELVTSKNNIKNKFDVLLSTIILTEEPEMKVLVVIDDVTKIKQQERLKSTLFELSNYAIEHTLNEVLRRFLDEAERLTGSNIGFFHFVNNDHQSLTLQTWSTNTLKNMCNSKKSGMTYPISEAGVWVDCIKARKPVIHNDYESLPHKKGLPEGHAPVVRELVVPVFRGEKIVAVLGVGNKEDNYSEVEVQIVQQLADMTWETVERKKAEKELEKYREQLELRVKQRTAELDSALNKIKSSNEILQNTNRKINEQKARLETTLTQLRETQSHLVQSEKMASLGVLTAGVAHEINNPLNYIQTGIYGLKNLIEQGVIQSSSPEQQETVLRAITTGVTRASNIVKSLKSFSRKGENVFTAFNIHDVIDNCLVMLNYEINNKCTINKDYTSESFVFCGNQENFHQVFINVLMNAVQSIKNKGIISIETKVTSSKKQLVINIVDNGSGISKENLTKIFDPFFTTKYHGKGTGLGLAIVYKIIQEHKGTISYNSELGKGTEVTIELPIAQKEINSKADS